MKSGRILLASSLLFACSLPACAMSHSRRGPTSQKMFGKKTYKASKPVKAAGQRTIDADRATEIQTALIKQGYLSGEATGRWDAETQAAMQKLQADNGWQTKLIPDSRAIIKLGLGPAHETEQASTGSLLGAQ